MPSVFDGATTAVDTFPINWGNTTLSSDVHPNIHNDVHDAVNKLERAVARSRALAADAAAVVGTAYANAGLAFPVEANVPRRFQFVGRWTPNAATTGGRFALNGPALTSLVYMVRWNTTATVITTAMGVGYDVAHAVGTAADAVSNIVLIEGVIVCAAAGDVQLRAAAEVVVPGSVQLRAGSSVLHW